MTASSPFQKPFNFGLGNPPTQNTPLAAPATPLQGVPAAIPQQSPTTPLSGFNAAGLPNSVPQPPPPTPAPSPSPSPGLSNADPNVMRALADTAEQEARSTIDQAEIARSNASDADIQKNFAEGFRFIGAEGGGDLVKRVIEQKVGTVDSESIDKMKNIVSEMQSLREGASLKHAEILNKPVDKMSTQEKQGMALVALIPVLMGAMMGGRKGIIQGIGGALAGLGSLQASKEEREARRGEDLARSTKGIQSLLKDELAANERVLQAELATQPEAAPPPQEIITFRTPDGSEERLTDVGINGVFFDEAVSGAPDFNAVVKDVRDQSANFKAVSGDLDTLAQIVAQTGGEKFAITSQPVDIIGEDGNPVRITNAGETIASIKNTLLLSIRKLEATGALDKGSQEVIERIFPDISNPLRSGESLAGGLKDVYSRFEKKFINNLNSKGAVLDRQAFQVPIGLRESTVEELRRNTGGGDPGTISSELEELTKELERLKGE